MTSFLLVCIGVQILWNGPEYASNGRVCASALIGQHFFGWRARAISAVDGGAHVSCLSHLRFES